MKTLQEYIDKYTEIAGNLGYSGDGIEVIVQLLANASYISEVENIAYVREASLEKAILPNSKIQHCMNNMYSVFRGTCPRVLIKIQPTEYLSFKLNSSDPIIESQSFKVFYSGYYKLYDNSGDSGNTETGSDTDEQRDVIDTSLHPKKSSGGGSKENIDFDDLTNLDSKEYNELNGYGYEIVHNDITIPPSLNSETYIIEGIISPKNPVMVDKTIDLTNTYYIESQESDLSNDVWVEINGKNVDVTRIFADHILHSNEYVFDLTIPDYGSRIYVANYFNSGTGLDRSDNISGITTSTEVKASWLVHSMLEDYNINELKRLSMPGKTLTLAFNQDWLKNKAYGYEGNGTGVVYIDGTEPANLDTIHYKANRDRYMNSIIRSNSDVGQVLEEEFPNKIVSGGTTYLFRTSENDTTSSLTIYYIPISDSSLLSDKEIQEFKENRISYYIVSGLILVKPGTKYKVKFNISVELYENSSEDIETEIGTLIRTEYQEKFGVVFNEGTLEIIKSLISKYSNVKRVSELSLEYYNSKGRLISSSDNIDSNTSYYEIDYVVSSSVTKNTIK